MCGVIKVHNFAESLAFSHQAEDHPIWDEVYKKAFPSMTHKVTHRDDGWWQRLGIDRSVILADSRQIKVDEKVRGRNKLTGKVYKDIALEYYSSFERKVAGWVCKPLACDYIAYLIAPAGICYMLPVLQLQSAWEQNKDEWLAKHFTVKAKNSGYTTYSCAVPANEVMAAIGQQHRVSFESFEVN